MSASSDSFVMFFAFMAVVALIGIGLFIGVSAFYGPGYDPRVSEVHDLTQRTLACFQEYDFFSVDFSIALCGINPSIIELDHLIYFKRLDSGVDWFIGVRDFVTQCGLSDKTSAYPICTTGVLDKGGVRYEYVIGTNQRVRGVL